jgi:hypothetical protein
MRPYEIRTGEAERRVKVGTGLHPATYEEVRRIAELEGVSFVDFLRSAVEEKVDRHLQVEMLEQELKALETESSLGRVATGRSRSL